MSEIAAVNAGPEASGAPGTGPSRAERIAWLGALVAASAALCAALWGVPLLPTNDGPEHVMMGHIENHYEDPDTVYQHFLAPAPQYAGRGFAAIFVPLESVLPWRSALRITLAVMLLGWSWGFTALVLALDRSPGRRRRWVALLGFATAFQWTLYMGFFAFVVGSACGLWLLALAAATTEWSAKRLAMIGLGLLLVGFLHVFSALLVASVIGAMVLARGRTWRERLVGIGGLAVAALPLGVVFAFTVADQAKAAQTIAAEHTLWIPIGEKLGYLHRCFQPGSNLRGLLVFALAIISIAFAINRRSNDRGDRARPVERALAASSLVLFAASIAGPETLPGWQFFFERFLPLGVMLALSITGLDRLGTRARLVAAALLVAGTGLSISSAASMNRKLYERTADVFSGLDAPIRRHGPRLPIIRDPLFALPPRMSPVPGMVPLHAVAALFVAEQGGILPFMFIDTPSVHEFVGRDAAWEADFPPRPAPDKLQRVAHLPPDHPEHRRALDELARDGMGYEDVIMVSSPADADWLRRRGYAPDYQRGELFLGHYRGCAAEVVLPPIAGLRSVEYGWWPLVDRSRKIAVDRVEPGADGSLHVPLPGAPCGPIWVRVDSMTGACQGADGGGRLIANAIENDRNAIKCDLSSR